jgi:hypothetical protein
MRMQNDIVIFEKTDALPDIDTGLRNAHVADSRACDSSLPGTHGWCVARWPLTSGRSKSPSPRAGKIKLNLPRSSV